MLRAVWAVTAEMAPYLLLGFLIAGMLWKFLRPAWVERHLAGRGLWPSVKATLFGVPLPLCSCGVIPVSASLRQHGAGKGATAAFLMATPQTGVDSFFATYALLGPVFAIVRPVAALLTGFFGGAVVELFTRDDERGVTTNQTSDHNDNAQDENEGDDCCEADREADGDQPRTWLASMRYGLVTLPGDIAVSLLVGIVIAGAITALVGQNILEPYVGNTFVSMALMLVIGIPLYVCSTGSIPLALAFIHMGVTPGAALVFLVAGPATNTATIAVTWKVLGRRATFIYLAVIFLAALLSGLAIDGLAQVMDLYIPDMQHVHEHGGLNWLQHGSAALLLGLLGWSIRQRFAGGREQDTAPEAPTMPTAKLHITGMQCSHCADAAQRALAEVSGVENARVELESETATVRGNSFDRDALVRAVDELGYKVTSVDVKS